MTAGVLPAERYWELQAILTKMQEAESVFYLQAVRIGHHSWVEFTGVISEYRKICQAALAAGIDFTETSVHGSKALPMQEHQAAYLGEKFGCIFSSAFRDERLREIFLNAADIAEKKKHGPT